MYNQNFQIAQLDRLNKFIDDQIKHYLAETIPL